MRYQIYNWIKGCISAVTESIQDDSERKKILYLLDSFFNNLYLKTIAQVGQTNENKNLLLRFSNNLLPAVKNAIRSKNKSDSKVRLNGEENADVIFIPFQKSHFDVQYPIAKALKKDGINVFFVTNNFQTIQYAENISDGDVKWLDIDIDFGNNSKCFSVTYIKKAFNIVSKLDPFQSDGITVHFHEILKTTLQNYYHYFSTARQIAEIISEELKPSMVCVGNDITITGRAVSLFLKDHPISTSSIMHGSIYVYPYQLLIADQLYLYGKNDRQYLSTMGLENERLLVTGSPKLDNFFQKVLENRHRIHPAIAKLKDGKKMVLICLSGPGHSITMNHHLATVKMLLDSAAEFKDCKFVFKMARKEKTKFFGKHPNMSLPNVAIIEKNNTDYPREIMEWLKASDAVITGASTTACEAMVIEKSVITIDLKGHLDDIYFIREGISLHARNKKEFSRHLMFAINQEEGYEKSIARMVKFGKNSYANLNGNATELVVRSIKKCLQKELTKNKAMV